MPEGVEKRRCHRFEIPNAKAQYKKTGLLVMVKGYSKAYPVANVSKGGLAFLCEETFKRDEDIMLQLLAPNEMPLELRAAVRWHAQHPASGQMIAGVAFAPFGSKKGWNSLDVLDTLRRLEAQYGMQEN